ncbi:unnamed protein product [Adineta steineri]|uniref:Uncharacterized protein n=1 Tax=Adineta steineri TaxID=433720 RepID=A0A814HGL0_9BILA|nr:unnamed protein product [Adineta steineri]CAF1062650.1 unnamed protein product [Adineta steineri]
MDFNNSTISIYGERNSKRKDGLPQIQKTPKLPRIVLRNSAGFVLKTETTFQNQIYQAKANLLEPNRRLTDIEWRLPHAPVPSRPDYTRSLDYDDFRLYKKPLKPSDANTTEYADMKFWNYLLPDRRLDQVNVTRKTMEKYCRNGSGVPHPEFMTNFNFFKSAKQLYLAIVSSSSGLDKIIAGFGPWDDRKKMIMTQVLTSLLRGDLAALDDLPPTIRNQALLDLATLLSEGKLTGAMQEKVFTELAQSLSSLPPDIRAKVAEQLIKSLENVPPEIREQVIQQILASLDTLSEEDREKVLHDLVKKISSLPEESRIALIEKIMQNLDSLTTDAKIKLLQDLLSEADKIPAEMREKILQQLLDSLDTLSPEERERVLAELTKNLANLPAHIRQQLIEKLLEKSELLPPELRDRIYAEILKNVSDIPEEMKRKLVVELLKNVDNMDPLLRQSVMKEILNNLDLVDPSMHGQVLQNFLHALDDVPAELRDELLRKIIEKSSKLDDPEMKRQILEEILKNPANLSAGVFQELIKNVHDLPADLQKRLFAEIVQRKDDLPPSVLEELIRNAAHVPQAVLAELLSSVEKLAPSSLAELAKHLNNLPEELRNKLLADVMNSMDNLNDEQKAALIGELLKNQGNLNPQQLETLMKNLDGLDPALKEKVMRGLLENVDNLSPEVKQKLIQDLLNKDSGLDQATRVKLLAKLLENPDNLTKEERDKVLNQIMNEIGSVKDPEMKKKLLSELVTNLKDLPPETMSQLITNIQTLSTKEQKELLKQILDKFDELSPEQKEKLVDDLLKSAASMPLEVQKQMIADLIKGLKDLPPEERKKLLEKMLNNPNLDPSVRAKLMEEMLKHMDDLPPEERKKLMEKMLEDRDNLSPAMRAKLMNEMIKNINQMSPEERDKFLAELANDPDKRDLLQQLLNSGQISAEMKKKLIEEMTKQPIDPATLLTVLQNLKDIPPETLEKVLKSIEKMSGKELVELARSLHSLPLDVRQRVMKEILNCLKDQDANIQAILLQEMLRASAGVNPELLSDLIKNVINFTPTLVKELLIRAKQFPAEVLKELFEHIDEVPIAVLEDIIKNLEQLSGEVIAALLALKNLPPAIREKLIKEINSNKKLKDKLKAIDPLAKGIEGVQGIVPTPRPQVKKPRVNIPPMPKKVQKKTDALDPEKLANIDEKDLEAMLNDPNLPPEVRLKLMEELRKKRAKHRIADVPSLSKLKLEEIVDPLDYLYKYCIVHPDRMINYERVFLNTIKHQQEQYPGQNPPEDLTSITNMKRNNMAGSAWTNMGGKRRKRGSKQIGMHDGNDDEDDINKPNTSGRLVPVKMLDFEQEIINENYDEEEPPMKSETAQKLEKISYIIDDLRAKETDITQMMNATNGQISHLTADAIAEFYPEILDPNFNSKKKGGDDSEKPIAELLSYASSYTTEQLLARLSKAQLQNINSQESIKHLNAQARWSTNKLLQLRMRIDMLSSERERLVALDQEERQKVMYKYKHVEKFRRQQSPLWNSLHPTTDYEMNIEELENALRQINGQLFTDQECQYLKFILKIPGVKRINLRVFSIIAALSETVNQIEPFVRNLINKFDYEALDIKMQKAKELFYLMADKSQKIAPNGYVPLETLCVELSAGGIEQENIEHCKKKFDREGKNYVDFMDWLIYVPLFVEIHTRIISNPFQRYEDPLKPPKELENEN